MNKNHQVAQYSRLVLEDPVLADFVARLPGFDHMGKTHGEAEYYGASGLIARDLDLAKVPRTKARWSHGWKFQQIDRVVELGEYRDLKNPYLVARPEHRDVLIKEGFNNTHVVGMPFIYAHDSGAKRMKQSLLVCPGHVGNFSVAEWNVFSKNYSKRIYEMQDHFETIAVCLSASCVETGNWIEEFEALGIPWVMGASIYDRNALPRMKYIFSSFDCVTSNTIGSHLAYAAFCGCRVSICGWQDLYTKELLQDEPHFRKYPDVLIKTLSFMRESSLRERYPDLFRAHPQDAQTQQEWASDQLGCKFRRSSKELANLFGWTEDVCADNKLSTFQPDCRLGDFQESKSRFFPAKLAFFRRLRRRKVDTFLNENHSGYVEFCGKPFKYTNGGDLLRRFETIKEAENLQFVSEFTPSVIVDACAGDGLFMVYCRLRWPEARLLCLERDKNGYSALSSNRKTFGNGRCEVFNSLLNKNEKTEEFPLVDSQGLVVKRLSRSVTLDSLYSEKSISLLRLRLNPFDADLFETLLTELGRLEVIWIEWQDCLGCDGVLRLTSICRALSKAGYILAVEGEKICDFEDLEGRIRQNRDLVLLAERCIELNG